MRAFPILLITFFLAGCTYNQTLENIYLKRDSILLICKDKALLNRNNFFLFETFKKDKVNEYFISLASGKNVFERDSIQYTPDIVNWKFPRMTASYRGEVCDYIGNLSKKLEAFDIKAFRTDFEKLGIPLELYLNDGKTVIFAPDLNKISNSSTDYKKSLKKIKGDWYYTE